MNRIRILKYSLEVCAFAMLAALSFLLMCPFSLEWFINTCCNEYAYNVNIKLIPFEICLIHNLKISSDTNHSSKFIVVVVVAFVKKEKLHTQAKKTEQQAEQTHNLLINILVFVCDSYLFCASCIYWVMESRNH